MIASALRDALRARRDLVRRDRSRASRSTGEGGAVRGRAVRCDRPRDGVRSAVHAPRRSRDRLARDDCSSACPPALRERSASRAADRGRRAREPRRRSISRRSGPCPRTAFAPLSANSWLLGETLRGPRREDDRRRKAWCSRRERRVPRARGRHRLPRSLRRRAAVSRSARRSSPRDDRLPGDGHGSELRRAARLLHGGDGRQLRRRRRARRVREPARARGAHALTRR